MTGEFQATINELHRALSVRFQQAGIHLQAITGGESAADYAGNDQPTIAYLRPTNEAQVVEGLMGRDFPLRRLDVRRHPVIELRTTDQGLALELVVPPDAWCDQQNLTGKMMVERHRRDLRRMISRLADSFRLGFWRGTALDGLHLTPHEAGHPTIFDTWINTFCAGQDWFRIGVWYQWDDLPEALVTGTDELTPFGRELFQQLQTLYEFYTFIGWTGSNDYRRLASGERSDRLPAFACA